MSNDILKLPAGRFLGQTLRAHELADFHITEVFYPNGMHQPEHMHEAALYCFVISGTYIERFGHREEVRLPLAVNFYPTGTSHAESYRAPGRHLLVELGPRSLASARRFDVKLDRSVSFAGSVATWLFTRIYGEFCNHDSLSSLAIEGMMLELIAETSRRARPRERQRPQWLTLVEELLQARFADNLELKHIAALVGRHPAHVARVFRAFKNCTLGEYVRALRIKHAAQRMARTDASLAEIAAATGFSDQSHFSRTFKRQTGLLPSEFRASLRLR
ncbi:MAG: AraC family transcriptional regulator [Acidobacteria bacterium]|nr:MAG: AraC family transcriptional regulator [Acidobacteriota bacterium]